MELKTARLTILIDPGKKDAFEQLCRSQDMTPSQVVRRLIRGYMEDQDDAAGTAAPRKSSTPRKAAAPRKSSVARKSR